MGGGGGLERVYIFYIYVNIYRVPHFENSLRGYSVILGGVRVCVFNFLHLCEHLSSALSRCVFHSVVRTSVHEEVMELAFSDAVLVDRAFILSVLFLYRSWSFCLVCLSGLFSFHTAVSMFC